MTDQDHSNHGSSGQRSFFTSRYGLVLIGFLLIAGYFLVTEHRAHLALAIPYLPFLLLLACPFLHFFMHGGHNSHSDSNDDHGDSQNESGPHH